MFNFFDKPKKPRSLGANMVNIAYTEKSKRPMTYEGFTKISEDDNNIAYKDTKGNIKVGIAGSNSMSDALTDAKLFFGKDIKDTDRYKTSETFLKKVMDENKDSNIELFGHSLSGTIANQLQKDNSSITSTAYNPYILNSSQISDKTKNIRTYTDPASLLVANKMENQFAGSSLNPLESHSILNFKKGGMVLMNDNLKHSEFLQKMK